MKMIGARILLECLKKEKVDTLFCYPGGVVIPIFDELYKHGDGIKIIQPSHEQGGTHAADGYARSTGKTGVVLVTSGPGATNTITGIATAYMDSIPMVIISGQVSTSMIGTDAFQEADMVGITQPITKYNILLKDPTKLTESIKKAFYIANSGRPGPVLIDIPVDILKADIEFDYKEQISLESYKPNENGHPKQIKLALELIKNSQKPLIISGGGVNNSDATELLNKFADRYKIPVVNTLMGNGVNPSDDLYYGGIGMHGSIYANYAIQNSDLIIALGVRFSDRILGEFASFARNAKIIHVDIDPAEIDKNKEINLPIVGKAEQVLQKFIEADVLNQNRENWIDELKQKRAKFPMTYVNSEDVLKPQYIIQLANKYFGEDTIVTTDVGQNQMWVAQYYRFKKGRKFLTSGGLGTMGYSLPASIGAKVGNPENEVLMFAGDGGFSMTLQELITVKKYNLSIKMIIMDNNYLGMVRQWQELLCEERYSGTENFDHPDFAKIANVMGIKSITIKTKSEMEKAIKILAESKEAMLIHAIIDPLENVLPMIPAGNSLDNYITKI